MSCINSGIKDIAQSVALVLDRRLTAMLGANATDAARRGEINSHLNNATHGTAPCFAALIVLPATSSSTLDPRPGTGPALGPID